MQFEQRPERDKAQAGFTLVEMLVAMVLLSFISIALLGGLRFEGRVWNRASQQSSELEEYFAFQALVRRQYSNLSLLDISSAETVKFSGGRTSFEFLTFRTLPGLPPGLSVFETGLTGEEGTEGPQLYLRWSAAPDDNNGQTSSDESEVFRILLEDAEGINFSYFGPNSGSEVAIWQDTWSDTSSYPTLIRINFPRSDTFRRWPGIILSRGPGSL